MPGGGTAGNFGGSGRQHRRRNRDRGNHRQTWGGGTSGGAIGPEISVTFLSTVICGRMRSSGTSATGFAGTSCTMCCTGGALIGHAETPPTAAANTTAATR